MTAVADRPTTAAATSRTRRPAQYWWNVGAIVTGSVLIVVTSLRQPFNQNELQQILPYSTGDIDKIVHATRQPPLDPLIGALLAHVFGTGQWQQRLLPTLAGIGILILMSLLFSRLRTGWAGVFGLWVLALAPVFVRYSAYSRPYATVGFVMVLFIYAAQRWLDDPRWWWLALSAVAAVALPLTRVPEPVAFLGVTAATMVLFALLHRLTWRVALPLAAVSFGALVFVGYPMYKSLASRATLYYGGKNSPSFADNLMPGLHHIRTVFLPLMADWFPWWPVTVLALLAVLVLPGARRWLFGLWAWWPSIAAPVAWVIVYHFFTHVPYSMLPYRPRFFYFFAPALALVMVALARGIAEWWPRAPRWGRGIAVALLAAVLVGQVPATAHVVRDNEGPDFGAVASVLTHDLPDNAIVLYDNPNPAGWWRYPWIASPWYMGDRPKVVPLQGLYRDLSVIPKSGPVYVLLLDSECGSTICDYPSRKHWDPTVPGWSGRHIDRFKLYSPKEGQAGTAGVLEAAQQFGPALGSNIGWTSYLTAATMLGAEGKQAEGAATLQRMFTGASPSQLKKLIHTARANGIPRKLGQGVSDRGIVRPPPKN